ncbi:MAG: hypothetical protein K5905_06605 [Roseibium sp.]|uniref:hypothetical protein n=1 Tax=Roseibium sp. TaxID=1936156 RepID=UPI00263572E1|nr:hypothetical protein [Roseibium sp.]MCV0425123.1 hypothetical protein [Roseibium sp.]
MPDKEIDAPTETKEKAQTISEKEEPKSASEGNTEKRDPALIKHLKVAAAAITILATISTGVLAIMKGWISFLNPETPKQTNGQMRDDQPGITEQVKKSTETSFECIDLNPLMPNVIPHYLLNSIGSENFPYWLRIEGKNKCKKKWRVVVSFEPEQNVVLKGQRTEIEIGHLAAFGETITPDFTLPKNFVEKISISWTVFEDVTQEKLISKSIRANVLPPHTVSFDLKKPTGEDLDEGYILASLGAWTRRRLGAANDLGISCRLRDEGSRRLREVDALRSCYSRLFSAEAGSEAVVVFDRHIEFPARTNLKIPPPAHLLKEREANSLEAALLMMAVYDVERDNSIEFELVLVVAKDETVLSQRNKRVFVAWQHGRTWQALDMMKAGTLEFDENLEVSSAEIDRIFADDPSLTRKLSKTGAGYNNDRSIAVAEFHIARTRFGIQGLP